MDTITKEIAENEFQRFCDINALDVDIDGMDEEDAKAFAPQKRVIIQAMLSGNLVVNEEGEPVYTPRKSETHPNPITFHEPTGATLKATDARKKGENISKLFLSMADHTGETAKCFSTMAQRDLKVCMAITALFLS